jgi:signal transduction histidine kinase
MVAGDRQLLRAIAVNLISNAIKYSSKGSEVRMTLMGADTHFMFTVQDQGIGIPEADRARLFAAFQRGSNVGEIAGTGLGLAIVKEAVELHGGSIQFESQVGVGTTVKVTIPKCEG